RASDPAFAARMPGFLERALQRIHNGGAPPLVSAPLRTRAMRTHADIVITNGSGPLPANFLEADYAIDPGHPDRRLQYVAPWETTGEVRAGDVLSFSIEGATLTTCPSVPSGQIRLVYFQKVPTPSADSDTSWLMTDAPSVLFDALRVEAYQYLRNAEMMQASMASFSSAVNALQQSDVRAAHSGSLLYPRMPC
ncbi:MAG: hypothetical protein AAGF46_12865, partial [Pseudomonadota bacterium]